MEITPQQKKILLITVIIVVAVVVLLFLARLFSIYLSTRVSIPDLSESVVGGRLLGSKITSGEHKLEFRAKTSDGKIITDSVTFTAGTDPYGDDGSDPYASPTPTQDPYSS